MGTARGSSVSQGWRPSGDVSSSSTGSSDSMERRQQQFAAGLLSAVTTNRCHRVASKTSPGRQLSSRSPHLISNGSIITALCALPAALGPAGMSCGVIRCPAMPGGGSGVQGQPQQLLDAPTLLLLSPPSTQSVSSNAAWIHPGMMRVPWRMLQLPPLVSASPTPSPVLPCLHMWHYSPKVVELSGLCSWA